MMRALRDYVIWFVVFLALSAGMRLAERLGIPAVNVLCVEIGAVIVGMVWLLVLGHQNRRGIEENGKQLQAQLVRLAEAEASANAWREQYEIFRTAFEKQYPGTEMPLRWPRGQA